MDKIDIPLSSCKEAKFGFSLFSSNKMLSYCQHEPQRSTDPQPITSNTVNHAMLELEWGANLLKQPITRSLVAESCAIFKFVQRVSEGKAPLETHEQVKYSRLYRCALEGSLNCVRQSVDDLTHKPILSADHEQQRDDQLAELNSTGQLLHKLSVAWHLCELIFVDVQQTEHFLQTLLTWIRWHFNEPNQLAKHVMDTSATPHTHEKYWDLVFKFILRGELMVARSFLMLHPDVKSTDFVLVCDLLEKMPTFAMCGNLFEFSNAWQVWSLRCRHAYDQHIFSQEARLRPLIGLLSGDLREFKQHAHLTESWYHFMVALLLFTDPAVKEHEYTLLAQECIKHYYRQPSDVTTFDQLLVSAFAFDLMDVCKLAFEEFADDWWFVTHLIDVLYNGGRLQTLQVVDAERFRNNLVSEYAGPLMAHRSLWSAGVCYLNSLEMEQSRAKLEIYLERIPLTNRRTAQKVLVLADRFQLKPLQLSVCEVLARQALNEHRYSEALLWAIRSEQQPLITNLADQFLRQYMQSGVFPDEDLLSSLESLMLVSDRLTFLAKYYEFQQLIKLSHSQRACELLVSLLSSGIVPPFFRPVLVFDSIPLLKSNKCAFKPSQINCIFQALEELNNRIECENNRDDSQTPIYDLQLFKEKEKCLRLVISQKMIKAL
jgi:nuclear pore complex protein Nup85